MAHFRRRHPRTKTPRTRSHKTWFMNSWPAWWDIIYHRRPKRRETKRLERAVLFDRIEADAAAWPVRSNKSHRYYW